MRRVVTVRRGVVRAALTDDNGIERSVRYAARWRTADGRIQTRRASDEADARDLLTGARRAAKEARTDG